MDKLKDDKIKFSLANEGTRAATLESNAAEFPAGHVSVSKIKLDRDERFESMHSRLAVTPDTPIAFGTKPEDKVSRRELDSGKEYKLEIEFEENLDNDLFKDDVPAFYAGGTIVAEGRRIE